MEPKGEEVEWDKSLLGQERIKPSGLSEEPDGESKYGYFAGRHIIGRDTAINGGVYVGAGEREAIVVDDKKYPAELNDVYNKLIAKIIAKGSGYKKGLLKDVYELVQTEVPFNESATTQLIQKNTGSPTGNDVKIPLNDFIKAKTGMCRHEALLAGYLLERLKNNGLISPKSISVDRNFIPGRGGHAWVRYENSGGEIVIIDPAQNFIGTFKDANKLGGWDYNRPASVSAPKQTK